MTSVSPGASPDIVIRFQAGDFAGDWTLAPGHSSARLSTRSMWGLAPVKGTFTRLSGAATVFSDGKVRGTLAVDASSLSTRNRIRDKHLHSADFLDTDNHPAITFTVTRLDTAGGQLTAYGTLTVRGTTRPVAVPLQVTAAGRQVELTGTLTIDRSEFGLTWNQMGMASMKNRLTVTAVFTRP
jgi:polyisoprenoid-binding protein YceI